MTKKTCKECNEEKLFIDFTYNTRKSMYTDTCKECFKKRCNKSENVKLRKTCKEKINFNARIM